MRGLRAMLLLGLATTGVILPLGAAGAVAIPFDCAAIAARHGYAGELSRVRAAMALRRLYRLDRSDPEVARCRAAVWLLTGKRIRR